jgi:hypothetical protein
MATFEYLATARFIVDADDEFAGKQKVDDILGEVAYEVTEIEEVR